MSNELIPIGGKGWHNGVLYKVVEAKARFTNTTIPKPCKQCLFELIDGVECTPDIAPIQCMAHKRPDNKSVKFMRAEHKYKETEL